MLNGFQLKITTGFLPQGWVKSIIHLNKRLWEHTLVTRRHSLLIAVFLRL